MARSAAFRRRLESVGLLSSISKLFAARSAERQVERSRERIRLADTGQVLYAIGDVHGCLEQLLDLEQQIVVRAARLPGREHVVVLLGDLMDRGPQSAGVIDHLSAPPPEGIHRLVLAGNHELSMLEAFDDSEALRYWLDLGGGATLESYGMDPVPRSPSWSDLNRIRKTMAFLVPAEHRDWLLARPQAVQWREYFLVHAGVRPGVPLDEQTDLDLAWIREPFLTSDADFGAIVVHGHTPVAEPEWRANRIAIDTGCFMTGRLTAVQLGDGEPQFMTSRSGRSTG
jgi:serine/threonine protein phosphatase 1